MADELVDESGNSLHFAFVEMLFALAIAQVAVEAADLANSSSVAQWLEHLPAYTHLVLATVIIAASWVGWGSSKSSKSPIKHVFSGHFFKLLVDVFLVVCYFIIVRTVETLDANGDINPSANPEVLWTMVILITYFIWDLLTKGRPSFTKFLRRGWASLLCAICAIVAFMYLPTKSHEVWAVVISDVALMVLVVMFRAMKLDDFPDLGKRHWLWAIFMVVFVALVSIANRLFS
ncbi:MAG: hypothetical protein KDA88_09540 [Planctomycetaceae bacterium]|nr:hypothetical protein [Planctomycetaceae bacterium]MCB9949638.1 hypothetical protein [Planctomycetaceae bacterium]